jgi:parvulin-like peptidyl-prolyl isomerase
MRHWASVAVMACLALALPAHGQNKPAAMVNGEPIPVADVQAALALRPAELFPVSEAQRRLQLQEIIELLISEKLMKQFLAKNAPPVDEAEVNKQWTALAESLKAQEKTLADFCKETRQTQAQIRSGIANMLQYASYARRSTTDVELKRYFETNRDYFQKTTVRLSHIVIRIPVGSPNEEREEARKRLTELRRQIQAGKITFADAARQFSQCPSAQKGGEIGLVTRKWMVDDNVARAAFALKKDEVSDVIASEFGLHLLLVTERNEGAKVELPAVIDDVRDTYIEEMRQSLLTELRKSAKIEIYVR